MIQTVFSMHRGESWYDSVSMLEQAQYMKLDEQLPPWVELWATANPMVEKTIQRLKYKVGQRGTPLCMQ